MALCEFALTDISNYLVQDVARKTVSTSSFSATDERAVCGFRAFDLLMSKIYTVFAFVEGVGSGVTSQIAVKMSLDAFIDKATELSLTRPTSSTQTVVQSLLKEANASVFQYGGKMLAATKISGTAIVLATDGEYLSVAKAGDYDVFLWRKGRMVNLFEQVKKQDDAQQNTTALDRLIGVNKQILVDIATLKLKVGDVVSVATFTIPSESIDSIKKQLDSGCQLDTLTEVLAEEGFNASVMQDSAGALTLPKNIVCASFCVK